MAKPKPKPAPNASALGVGRIAIYLRISLDKTGEALGTDRQRATALKLVDFHNLGGEIEQYLEPGSLSASKKRPANSQYARLLEDAQAGRIRVLIVWDIDRLTRIPREIEDWLDLCEKTGLRIITLDGECDTNSANGRMFLRIKAAVARHEIEHKSARQKAAHEQRATQGKPWWTRRPFGYEMDGTLRVREAAALEAVYQAVWAGEENIAAHARSLNELGFTGTRGQAWQQSSLRQVLISPRNAAIRTRFGQEVRTGLWEAVVPEDIFRVVVQKLTQEERKSAGRPAVVWLTSIAKCGVCGGKIGAGSSPYDGSPYYTCRVKRCVSHPRHEVDVWVAERVIQRLCGTANWNPKAENNDIAIHAEIARIDERLNDLVMRHADEEITTEQLTAGTARLTERRKVAVAKLSGAPMGAVLVKLGLPADADETVTRGWWKELDLKQQRTALKTLFGEDGGLLLLPRGRGVRGFDPERLALWWQAKDAVAPLSAAPSEEGPDSRGERRGRGRGSRRQSTSAA